MTDEARALHVQLTGVAQGGKKPREWPAFGRVYPGHAPGRDDGFLRGDARRVLSLWSGAGW